MGEAELVHVRNHYAAEEDPLTQVNLGFPQILLDIDAPLDELLRIWHEVTPTEPFIKENIDEALYLYDQAKSCKQMIDGFQDKHILYKMVTCPIDVKDKKVVELWLQYCCTYTADVSLEKPVLHREKKEGSNSMRHIISSWICIISFLIGCRRSLMKTGWGIRGQRLRCRS